MVDHFHHWFINMKDSSFPFGVVGRSLAPPFFSLPFSALPTGGGYKPAYIRQGAHILAKLF
jgi:hypothetical protein